MSCMHSIQVAYVVQLCVHVPSEQNTNAINRNKLWSKLLSFVTLIPQKERRQVCFGSTVVWQRSCVCSCSINNVSSGCLLFLNPSRCNSGESYVIFLQALQELAVLQMVRTVLCGAVSIVENKQDGCYQCAVLLCLRSSTEAYVSN